MLPSTAAESKRKAAGKLLFCSICPRLSVEADAAHHSQQQTAVEWLQGPQQNTHPYARPTCFIQLRAASSVGCGACRSKLMPQTIHSPPLPQQQTAVWLQNKITIGVRPPPPPTCFIQLSAVSSVGCGAYLLKLMPQTIHSSRQQQTAATKHEFGSLRQPHLLHPAQCSF